MYTMNEKHKHLAFEQFIKDFIEEIDYDIYKEMCFADTGYTSIDDMIKWAKDRFSQLGLDYV